MLTQQKFLSTAEKWELRKNLRLEKNKFHVLAIEVLTYTGARGIELVDLEPGDLCEGGITVRGAKNGNDRTLPLPPRVFAKLLKLAREVKTGKLFPISTRMLRKIWAKVRPVLSKGVHSLRHTVGVDFYKESRDVHGTGGVLGHKSIANTMIYLTFVESQEQRKDVFKKIWKAA